MNKSSIVSVETYIIMSPKVSPIVPKVWVCLIVIDLKIHYNFVCIFTRIYIYDVSLHIC